MKKIYQYICILAAMLLSVPAVAQNDQTTPTDDATTWRTANSSGLGLHKEVTPVADKDGKFYITVDAFATGNSVSTVTESEVASDIILCLDYSTSMTRPGNDVVKTYKQVGTSTTTYKYNGSTSTDNHFYYGTSGNERATYLYEYNGKKYSLTEEKGTIPTDSYDYYWLEYTTADGKVHYLDGAQSKDQKPTGYTNDATAIYTGKLYDASHSEITGKTFSYNYVHSHSNEVYYLVPGVLSYEKQPTKEYKPADFGEGNPQYYFYVDANNAVPVYLHTPTTTDTYSPVTKDWKYNDIQDNNSTYYYKVENNYYLVKRGKTKSTGNKNYHYFFYEDNNNKTVYITSEKGAEKNNDDVTVYSNGTLYVKNPNCYYLYYTDSGKTKYIAQKVGGPDDGKWMGMDALPDNWANTHASADAVVYSGQLAIAKPGEDHYYQVTAGKDTAAGTRDAYSICFYDENGTKYYLNQDGGCSTVHPGYGQNDVLYTGILYERDEHVSRLQVTKAAAIDFVNTVATKAKGADGDWDSVSGNHDDVAYKVGVVIYGPGIVGTPQYVTINSDENVKKLTDYITNTSNNSSGTRHEDALKKAYDFLQPQTNITKEEGEKRPQTVILFTDGEPYDGTNNNSRGKLKNGNSTVKYAKEYLKDNEVPIYVVSLLGGVTYNQYPWITTFLKYTSSMYPDADNVVTNPDGYDTNLTGFDFVNGYDEFTADPKGSKYYQSSDGTDLSSIFTKIAGESTTGGSTISKLDETNCLVTVDVLSKFFMLPKDISADKVEIYIQKCTETRTKNGATEYGFGGELLPPGSEISIEYKGTTSTETVTPTLAYYQGTVNGKDVRQVDVYNFNFGKYWCGDRVTKDEQGQVTSSYTDGYRLVFRFPVEIDPANPGGCTNLFTNDASSGIYTAKTGQGGAITIDQTTKLPKLDEGIDNFNQPQVNLPNIVIRKAGMQKYGESATFLIEAVDENGHVIMSNNKPAESFTIVISCDDANPQKGYLEAKVKLQGEARYRVTETSWAWGYTPNMSKSVKNGPGCWTVDDNLTVVDANNYSITRNVNASTQEPDGMRSSTARESVGTIFYFYNDKNNNVDEMKYSESFKRNVFYTPKNYEWHNPIGSSSEEIVMDPEPATDEEAIDGQ